MADVSGNGADLHGRYLALDERVTNIRTSMTNLEGEMQRGFSALNNHLTALSNEFRNSSKTQWPIIFMAAAVVLTILGGAGAILYSPIKDSVVKLQENSISRNEWSDFQQRASENRSRLELALAKVAENMVTQASMVPMIQEYRDYKMRIDTELHDLTATKLSRSEWQERNQSRDHDIENLRSSYLAADVNLQRQLDQQIAAFNQFAGSLGNGRDVLQRLQSEYDRLRDQIADVRSLITRERPLPSQVMPR